MIKVCDHPIAKLITHKFGSYCAVAAEDSHVYFVDLNNHKVCLKIKGGDDAIASLCWDQSGLLLATGCHDGSVKVFDVKNMAKGEHNELCHVQNVHTIKDNEGVLGVCVQSQQQVLLTSGADGFVKVHKMC